MRQERVVRARLLPIDAPLWNQFAQPAEPVALFAHPAPASFHATHFPVPGVVPALLRAVCTKHMQATGIELLYYALEGVRWARGVLNTLRKTLSSIENRNKAKSRT